MIKKMGTRRIVFVVIMTLKTVGTAMQQSAVKKKLMRSKRV
jgi:hypothetical protein